MTHKCAACDAAYPVYALDGAVFLDGIGVVNVKAWLCGVHGELVARDYGIDSSGPGAVGLTAGKKYKWVRYEK